MGILSENPICARGEIGQEEKEKLDGLVWNKTIQIPSDLQEELGEESISILIRIDGAEWKVGESTSGFIPNGETREELIGGIEREAERAVLGSLYE